MSDVKKVIITVIVAVSMAAITRYYLFPIKQEPQIIEYNIENLHQKAL